MHHTILVIEDNDDLQLLFRRILEPENYHVLLASDGIEGLRLISELHPCRPSLILLDWRMPKMSGGELLARLQELGFAHRTVVVTAASLKENEVLEAGARRFLAKPFGVDELLGIVEELTNTPSAKMEAVMNPCINDGGLSLVFHRQA